MSTPHTPEFARLQAARLCLASFASTQISRFNVVNVCARLALDTGLFLAYSSMLHAKMSMP